jgi:8-oxo-dGTP diphosphatase
MIHQGDILLCRNLRQGHLYLPGGHVEFAEPARDALEREMREEAGVDLRAGRLLGVLEASFQQPDRRGQMKDHHELNLVFELRLPSASDVDPQSIRSLEPKIQLLWVPLANLTGPSPKAAVLPENIHKLLVDIALIGSMAAGDRNAWLGDLRGERPQ